MRSLSVRKPAEAVQKPVKPGIRVKSGIRIGGIDPGGNHSRRLSALLAKEDRAIRRREKAISRELKRLGRGR